MFHPGLTYDQKASIVHQSIDNQLFTDDRLHRIEILGDSINVCKFIEDPIEIKFTRIPKYEYTLKFEFYE